MTYLAYDLVQVNYIGLLFYKLVLFDRGKIIGDMKDEKLLSTAFK